MTTPNNSTTATTRAPADNHTRGDLVGGRLRRLVDQGIQGVTFNPTIIAKAINGSADYDRQLATLAAQGRGAEASYWSLVADDLNGALAVLRPVYDRGGGADGFVSVEPAPALARDAEASVAAGRALHRRLDAPNLLVKIPATVEGVAAVRQATAKGLSINVTLLFGLDRYEEIITEVDRRLQAIGTPEALALQGKAAVAQARLAYRLFRDRFSGPRWAALAARGARPQRPLWASTSTQEPRLSRHRLRRQPDRP
jgi:transaldolase